MVARGVLVGVGLLPIMQSTLAGLVGGLVSIQQAVVVLLAR
jgi:hypothetical protein